MKKKLTCLLLCVLLAMGQVQAAAPEQAQQPTTQPTAAEQQMAEMEAELELSQLPLYDRYIVKLKPTNSLAAVNTTLNAAVEAAIPAAKQAANTQVQAVLDAVQVDETEAFDLAETPSYTVDEQSAELLTVTLTEKVDAAAFTAELSGNAQIEYIQPDYTLELASDVVLDLDLSELTPAGTPVPAVTAAPEATSTPEIGIEITPVQTPIPEATLEPEETPEPAPDVTAEPTPEATPTPAAAPVVAVIDAGIDVAHHGLIEQMLPGYDFVNNTELVYDSSKKDEYYHGTHVAGVIAQNAPTAQILPLKVFEHGRAYTSDVIRAIEYAEEHGASIVNMSFGGADDNRALREAMQERNMLFVCAAGNARTDVEEAPVYPACFDLENIISVASLNQDLGFSYYSNYGTESVDIAAVGRDVYSMWPESAYGTMSGTSQAAAQVSAGAAEALARGDADAKAAVLERADRYTHLMNKVADGRSLNLFNVAAGVVSEGVQTVEYEDDFDVHGYQPTPEENWELFSSVPNVQVAAGYDTSYVVKSDGSVWAWGNNRRGLLGDGTKQTLGTPIQVIGLSDIVKVSVGCGNGGHVLALKADGTLWSWGNNMHGQLGDGTTVDHTIAAKVPGISSVKDIAAGDKHSLALRYDGSVWAWGNNGKRECLNDTSEKILTPAKVQDIDSVKSISAGDQFSMASTTDGDVYIWGTLITGHMKPTKINNVSNISQVEAGNNSAYAVSSNGIVYAWGENEYGQLGIGTKDNVTAPTQISGLDTVERLSTGGTFALALKADGTVYAWGNNSSGQLGNGTLTESLSPVVVSEITNIALISSGYMHSVALDTDGDIWVWGNNRTYQLGDGEKYKSSPVLLQEIPGISTVNAGNNHALALKPDGTVWSWGSNEKGQLGNGHTVWQREAGTN